MAGRLRKLGPDHVDAATTYNDLGLVHSDLGELQEAVEPSWSWFDHSNRTTRTGKCLSDNYLS